ncbi:MAG: hypothetical protein IKP72_08500 [Clostridia bacterium]|nr:hypothetical protein [Clostridia bacterium]
MKKIVIEAFLLIVLGIAAYVFIARPAVQFSGERTVSSDPASFSLRFTVLNATDAQTLSFREGADLAVSWQIESGSIDLVIAMEGEEPLYQANGRGNGDAAAFDLTIPKSGEYTITVTGKNAGGWLKCEEK